MHIIKPQLYDFKIQLIDIGYNCIIANQLKIFMTSKLKSSYELSITDFSGHKAT